MNQQQIKFLKVEMNKIARDHEGKIYDYKKPVRIVAAEKSVEKWKKDRAEQAQARRRGIRDAENECLKAILFGEHSEAEKALAAFRKMKF